MDKLLKDSEGNIYRAKIVTKIPDGLEDISDLEIPSELAGMDLRFLRFYEGQIVKQVDADKNRRNEVLDKLRALREPMLSEADIMINKAEDAGEDATALRAYRVALREVPQEFIKVDGDPKVAVDNIDLDNFAWPAKPE